MTANEISRIAARLGLPPDAARDARAAAIAARNIRPAPARGINRGGPAPRATGSINPGGARET